MTESAGRKIVAGVDGSPSSVAALRWAIDEAKFSGDTVEAVIAWECSAVAGSPRRTQPGSFVTGLPGATETKGAIELAF